MMRRMKLALLTAAAAGALMMAPGRPLQAQSPDPNAAPNPYKLQENWAQLPAGQKFGQVIKVQVDHSDGKTIFAFDRCGAGDCTNSKAAPIEKFDASGKLVAAYGAGDHSVPHGLYIDQFGFAWAGDQFARDGKGAVVIKYSLDGKAMMTIGHPGMPGNGPDYLSSVSAIAVAANGDIYVCDGHGDNTNNRIVKYSKDGKFLLAWGKQGKGQGEFDQPHGIALDKAGRVYVADRVNNRVQVFEPDGKFVAEWKQFGRPSDVAIDKNDMIYVTDSQSTDKINPGFKQGIRVGSVQDGKVTAFIPAPEGEVGSEAVGVDDAGNVYGGFVANKNLRKYAKS